MLVIRPPVITGMTTINEGDTLYLDCDAIDPIINVMWLSPEGIVVSNEMNLVIMNIQRSAAGTYTCEATHKIHGTTRNSTVNVTVQCECLYSVYLYNYTCTKVVCEEGELGTSVHVRVANTFIIICTHNVSHSALLYLCMYISHTIILSHTILLH